MRVGLPYRYSKYRLLKIHSYCNLAFKQRHSEIGAIMTRSASHVHRPLLQSTRAWTIGTAYSAYIQCDKRYFSRCMGDSHCAGQLAHSRSCSPDRLDQTLGVMATCGFRTRNVWGGSWKVTFNPVGSFRTTYCACFLLKERCCE